MRSPCLRTPASSRSARCTRAPAASRTPGDGAADALRRAGDEGDAAVKLGAACGDELVEGVDQASGRRPSSTSWISATSRSRAGVASPSSRAELGDDRRSARRSRSCACGRRGRARCRNGSSPVRRLIVGQPGDRRPAPPPSVAPGAKASGSKPLKPRGLTPRAVRDRHHLPAERQPDRERGSDRRSWSAIESAVSAVREQHRAVGELAPEIAPDVVGQHRVGLEEPAEARACARVRVADSRRRSRRRRPRRGCRRGCGPARASRRRN